MENVDSKIIAALIGLLGLIIGFYVNYYIEKFKAKNTLLQSLSSTKVELFKDLWGICESTDLKDPFNRYQKFQQLSNWYQKGGGLLLSFEASERMLWAKNLLEASINYKNTSGEDLTKESFEEIKDLEKEEVEIIKEQLSWLRTDIKEIVGSYSKKETKIELSQIPGQSNSERKIVLTNIELYKKSKLIEQIKKNNKRGHK